MKPTQTPLEELRRIHDAERELIDGLVRALASRGDEGASVSGREPRPSDGGDGRDG